jgi:DNA replication and repair protein RecF
MRIETLQAHAFRNLSAVELTPQARTIVLQGDNGQGKTNILEALYLCATGRSFRRATAGEMVATGAAHGRCQALLQRQGVRHSVQVDLGQAGPHQPWRQRLQVDDRALRQSAQLLQLINVVAFFPDDLRIIKGSPEERRRFFDRAVAGGRPPFVEATLAYHRALKSRNALLRAQRSPERGLLAAYDAQLVAHGAAIVAMRAEALEELRGEATRIFAELMPGLSLGLRLHTGVSAYEAVLQGASGASAGTPSQSFASCFADVLEHSFVRDRARGMTLSGPHRADLLCEVDGLPARSHASQGQQRALVLALKLAEMACLRARLEAPPILLLDDVSSELDRGRTERLFAAVAALGSQVWVTTTGAVPLPIAGDAQLVHVEGGSVRC